MIIALIPIFSTDLGDSARRFFSYPRNISFRTRTVCAIISRNQFIRQEVNHCETMQKLRDADVG